MQKQEAKPNSYPAQTNLSRQLNSTRASLTGIRKPESS